MKTFAVILLLTGLTTAFAKSRIVDVVPGEKNEDTMVLWSDGKVTFVDPEKAKSLPQVAPKSILPSGEEISSSYEPTVLGSVAEAQKLLRAQRVPPVIQWNIQCYNMAHVRAYEAWKDHGVKSHKMFLFFTKSYIRKYRFKWWFHVTPMVHVNVDGKVQQLILDREWARTPLLAKDWTDKWMENKAPCPVISKYSSYSENQESESCYLYPISMYYWQPLHLAEFEESRRERTDWKMSEVNTAYARDF